jgi:hypothetical protein
MKRTVIILGAGASAGCGAPLMKDFLDKAENVKPGEGYTGEEANRTRESFRIVFKGLRALRHAYAKSKIDTRNVESVFAAFEMAKLLGTLPGLASDEIELLPSAMQHVIRDTLETNVRFQYDGQHYVPPWPYNDFIHKFVRKADLEKLTLITFNYDISLEYALFFNGIHADYCVGDDAKPAQLKVLKLHGSLNWFRCEACKQIAPITIAMLNNQHMLKMHPISETQFILRLGPYVNQLRHIPGKECVLDGPVVVPPTSNKLAHHTELQPVWSAAAKDLATAENVLVFGYSLPASDHFFRYLYALGSIGDARPKRFWVFDPCPDNSVEQRFADVLGPETADRFYMHKLDFNAALQAGNWQEEVLQR